MELLAGLTPARLAQQVLSSVQLPQVEQPAQVV
jgi:hypothetical protein